MEPIDEWIDDACKQVAPRSPAEMYSPPSAEETKMVGSVSTKEEALAVFLNAATYSERAGLTDNVVLPKHYARFNIEPIRFIVENNLNFFQANIVKYIMRWDAKNGLEDLQKAKRYLNMFIRFVQKDPDWWKAPTSSVTSD